MATEKAHPSFADYTAVNNQIYVRPSNTPQDIPRESPTVVLLYSWGDSNPKHVVKYADGYRELYPAARIVVVFGPILKAITQTLPQRSRTMAPVVDAIFDGSEDTEAHARERLMVICMSNTGGINFGSTLHAYRQRYGVSLPHKLLICDSTPGNTEFFRNVAPWSRAMALGAAKFFPWPFVVTQVMAALFLGTLHGLSALLGITSAAEFSVKAVNDARGFSNPSAAKLYLYSKADDIISWEDIEEHAADAVSKGYDVALEMFEDSPHVEHMRLHTEQYWGAISSRWKGLYGC